MMTAAEMHISTHEGLPKNIDNPALRQVLELANPKSSQGSRLRLSLEGIWSEDLRAQGLRRFHFVPE